MKFRCPECESTAVCFQTMAVQPLKPCMVEVGPDGRLSLVHPADHRPADVRDLNLNEYAWCADCTSELPGWAFVAEDEDVEPSTFRCASCGSAEVSASGGVEFDVNTGTIRDAWGDLTYSCQICDSEDILEPGDTLVEEG